MTAPTPARSFLDPDHTRKIQDSLYAILVLGVTVAMVLFLIGSSDLITSLTVIGILLALSLAGSTLRFLSMTRVDSQLHDAQEKTDQAMRVLQHRVGDHDLLLMKMATQLDTLEQDVGTLKSTQAHQTQEQTAFMAAMKSRLMMVARAIGQLKNAPKSTIKPSRPASPPKNFFGPLPASANDEPRAAEPPTPEPASLSFDDIHISPTLIREAIETALKNNRMDVYVQPLATLPQRHIFGFEVTGRLRVDPGLYISAGSYRGHAQHAGQMVALDRLVLASLRPLVASLRPPRLFVNITAAALMDPGSVTHLTHLMLAYPDLKHRLVVFLGLRDFMRAPESAHRVMEELKIAGVAFGVGDVTDSDLDLNALARTQIRYLKLAASRLVGPATRAEGAALLQRFTTRLQERQITLIVGAVEDEHDVRTLLDFPINLAQGALFGRPDRPVAYPPKSRVA